jgi:hypothetical protein
MDPSREIVFDVGRLGCSLVQGVGCGHLLAPTLAGIDKVEGVSRSYSNWTGTRLRVSAAPGADRDAVAARVAERLARHQYEPSRVGAKALAKALEGDEWRGAERVHELSSFEFLTHAKQRIQHFAERERLGKEKSATLQRLVGELWEESGKGKGRPPGDEEGYSDYWDDRIETFKAALLRRAADVLTEGQLSRLAAEGARRE